MKFLPSPAGLFVLLVLLPPWGLAQRPLESPVHALQTLAEQPSREIDIARAALLADRGVHSEVDPAVHLAALDRMAEYLRPIISEAPDIRQKLEAMARVIYEEWNYADAEALPADVFVGFHQTLQQRQWNCFGMSILYLALGERLGLPFKMVSGRGHVFVQLDAETPLYVETTRRGTVYESKDYLESFVLLPCVRAEEYLPLDRRQTVAVLLTQTALALQHQERLPQAESYFKLALGFHPADAEAHAGLGYLYLSRNRIMDAGEAFRKSIEANPNLREAYGGIGLMLHQAGQVRGAIQAYKRAYELCADEPATLYNLGQLLAMNEEPAEAVAMLERYTQVAPKDVDGHIALAQALDDAGNLDAAARAYEAALRLDRSSANLVDLGYVQERLMTLAAAEQYYREALQKETNNPLAHAGLGRLALQQQRYADARLFLERAVALDKENGSLFIDLGKLERAEGNHEKALEAFQRAITLDPTDIEAYTEAAATLRQLGRGEEAEALLKQPGETPQ